MLFKRGIVLLILALNIFKVEAQTCVYSEPVTLPYARNFMVFCPVSTGSHSFTVNSLAGLSLAIRYYSTDGPNCASIYNDGDASGGTGYDYPSYSDPLGTLNSSITVTDAPCKASPCCVVIGCVRNEAEVD